MDRKKIIARAMEKLAATRPPKKWWDDTHESVMRKNKGLSSDRVDKIVGDLWYNKMDEGSRAKVKKEFQD